MTKYVPQDIDSQNGIRGNQYQDFIELMVKKNLGLEIDVHKALMDDEIRSQVMKKGAVHLDNGLRFVKCTSHDKRYCLLFQVEGEWVCSGGNKPKKGFWKAMRMTDDWHWSNPSKSCPYRLMNKQGFDEEKEAEYIYSTLAREHEDYERVEYDQKNY